MGCQVFCQMSSKKVHSTERRRVIGAVITSNTVDENGRTRLKFAHEPRKIHWWDGAPIPQFKTGSRVDFVYDVYLLNLKNIVAICFHDPSQKPPPKRWGYSPKEPIIPSLNTQDKKNV